MVNLRGLFLQSIICRFCLAWVFAYFFHDAFSATKTMNVGVSIGEVSELGDVLKDGSGINKIGKGLLVFPAGQSDAGPISVLEGGLVSNGPVNTDLIVESGATYRSSVSAGTITNRGNVETGLVTDDFASCLTLTNFIQDALSASFSVKIFPDGTCDYLKVNTANLTGQLRIYVAAGSYPSSGRTYPVIRADTSVSGAFLSLVNESAADVALSSHVDATTFNLIVKGNVPYVIPTSTAYECGIRLNVNQRRDTIKIGGTGGFNGFVTPEDWCEVLFINFVQTGSAVEQNTILTNAYTGIGDVPELPEHVQEVWITGDPTGYDVLVAGGAQYALPLPGPHTRIRFALSRSPATDPLTWFQGALPVGCTLVVEPGSADPFIKSVLPLRGGNMIIGSNVEFGLGVAALLASSEHCPIQRYPVETTADLINPPIITITEPTAFQWGIYGLSIRGEFPVTFSNGRGGHCRDGMSPNLFNPDSTGALYNIEPGCLLTIYRSPEYVLPEIDGCLVEGGASRINISTNLSEAIKAYPEIVPPLNQWIDMLGNTK